MFSLSLDQAEQHLSETRLRVIESQPKKVGVFAVVVVVIDVVVVIVVVVIIAFVVSAPVVFVIVPRKFSFKLKVHVKIGSVIDEMLLISSRTTTKIYPKEGSKVWNFAHGLNLREDNRCWKKTFDGSLYMMYDSND